MLYKANKIVIFLIINILIFVVLYSIPINSEFLEKICIFKNLTGKECINCGMTRAFLSTIHFELDKAFEFNRNIVIVFPYAVGIYLYSWYKYIMKGGLAYERKK